MKSVFDNDELIHHGIKGQRWGVRRFQNADGSLKPAGERRYGVNNSHSNTQNNGTGAVKPSGARNPTYVLGSASAKRRGSGLGTGPVGNRGKFAGGGAGHTFANNGGGGQASESGGAGRDTEPKPIGSDAWWEWYENTDDREKAEAHYNMVIAKESRDEKRNKHNNVHADTAPDYARARNTKYVYNAPESEAVRNYNQSRWERKRDHYNSMRKKSKVSLDSVMSKVWDNIDAVKKAARMGKEYLSRLPSGKEIASLLTGKPKS